MDIKFFMGFKQVSAPEYNAAFQIAQAEGNIIASSSEVDGHKEYTLKNGIIIRGDNKGGFNRVENGEVMEPWQLGSENEYIQGETTDYGSADFFFKVG